MADLALAVRITGDASGLRTAAGEAVSAVRPVVTAVEAASGRLNGFGAAADSAATGIREAGGASRDATAALTPTATAVETATGKLVALERAARDAATATRAIGGAGREAAAALAPVVSAVDAASGTIPARGPDGRYLPRSGPGASAPAPAAVPATPGGGIVPVGAPANSNAPGLRPDQWKNIGFQINDVVTSLGSGAPAMQVLAQQGGQVFQVLQDAPGGVAGALKIIASRALGLVTPATLAAGAVAAIGTAGIVAALRWKASQEAIEQSLTGIGARSGATVGQINRIGEAVSGRGVSAASGRDIASTLAGTGRIDVGNIQSIAGLAPGFSKLFGGSISEAGDSLARIFSDPVKGAAELDARLGSLDDKTQQYIRTLTAQGNRQEAIAVLVRSVQPELDRAAEKTSAWAKAWNAVSGAADVAGRAIINATGNGSLDDRLAEANRRLEAAKVAVAQKGNANTPDEDHVSALRAMGYTEEQIRAEVTPTAPGTIDTSRRTLETSQAQAEDLGEQSRRSSQGSFRETRNKQLAEFSTQVGDAVRSLTPEVDQLESLKDRITALTGAQDSPELLDKLGVSAERLKQAIGQATGAVSSFLPAQEKQRLSEELTIRSIEARTVAEKAAIAAEQKRLELSGTNVDLDRQRQAIETARAAVLAQSTRESQDRLRSANDNAASAGLLPYQRQLADLETKYREIFKNEPPANRAINEAAKAAERSAIDKVAIGSPIQDANRSLSEQAAALRLQQESFGASTEAAARMAAAQQLINKYTADGVPITDELRKSIDAYAAASGRGAATSEDVLRKQRQVVGALDDVRSTTRGGLTGIYSDLRQGKSPWESIKSQLGGFSDRLFERTVSAPATEALFGQDGKAGGGLFGGALTSLFGKQAGLSTATITAGVVNVNGAVAGLGGLGGANGLPSATALASGGASGGNLLNAAGRVDPSAAFSYLKGKGLNDAQTAAILGNVQQESGFNPGAFNPKEGAFGLYQTRLDRLDNLKTFASTQGTSAGDPKTQLDFMLKEMSSTEASRGGRSFLNATDLGDANSSLKRFIRYGDDSEGDRLSNAQDLLKRFGGRSTPAASAPVASLDKSLESVSSSATTAADGVSGLTGNLDALPNSLSSVSSGLDKLGSSLGSAGGGGTGLTGLLGRLFGLGGGSGSDLGPATPGEVMVASGGHIRGPGTGTSDSIAAWLSHGEFVVNAHATSQHLPLLHDINNHRLPGFSAGGPVTPLVGYGRANDNAPAPAGGGSGAPVLNFITPPGMALESDGQPRQESDGSWTIGLKQLERAHGARMKRQQGDLHAAAMLSASGGAAGRRG